MAKSKRKSFRNFDKHRINWVKTGCKQGVNARNNTKKHGITRKKFSNCIDFFVKTLDFYVNFRWIVQLETLGFAVLLRSFW